MATDYNQGQQRNIGVGISVGVAVGVTMGLVLGYLALGISLGVALGVAFGPTMAGKRAPKPGAGNPSDDSREALQFGEAETLFRFGFTRAFGAT